MVTWIILGVFIFVVAILLVWSSIKEKKNKKEAKLKREKLELESEIAKVKIAIWTIEVKKVYDAILKKFVPSIGEFKMRELKKSGQNCMKELINGREFKMAGYDKDNKINKLILDSIILLSKEQINSWDKKMKNEFEIIKKASKINGQELESFRINSNKKIKKIFIKANKAMVI